MLFVFIINRVYFQRVYIIKDVFFRKCFFKRFISVKILRAGMKPCRDLKPHVNTYRVPGTGKGKTILPRN